MYQNPVSKKLATGVRRQDRPGHGKFAIDKYSIARKTPVSTYQVTPEHPLGKAFSEAVNKSRLHLKNMTQANIDAVYKNLSKHLRDSTTRCCLEDEQALAAKSNLFLSLDGDKIKWDSDESSNHRIAELGKIIKSLDKMIITAERELAAQHIELSEIDNAIYRCANESLGSEDFRSSMTGASETSAGFDGEQQQLQAQIEAERMQMMRAIEVENVVTQEALNDIEKVGFAFAWNATEFIANK
ncbi:MAG: hypothetical protein Q9163_006537 [Psora crenata]